MTNDDSPRDNLGDKVYWDEDSRQQLEIEIEENAYSFVPEKLKEATWYILMHTRVSPEQRQKVWEALSTLDFYEINAFRDYVLEELAPDAQGSWAHDYVNRAAKNWIGSHAYKAAEESVAVARESVWMARIAIAVSLVTLVLTFGYQLVAQPDWPEGRLEISLVRDEPIGVRVVESSNAPVDVSLTGEQTIKLPSELEAAMREWLKSLRSDTDTEEPGAQPEEPSATAGR